MVRFWLLGALLAAWANPARAIQAHAYDPRELAASVAAPSCEGASCPSSTADAIFFAYGTACSGLDWRFLRAVAKVESGIDPRNHTGKYVGLFQLDKDACGENLPGSYKSFLSCRDLEDPEANTAAAADRFDRYFRGRGGYPSILETCPGNTPAENMALAYVGHNNGPAVLRAVLRRGACKDKAIRRAIAAFYERHPQARVDGKYVAADGRLVSCSAKYDEKYGIVGTKSYRCVNAKWGIAKYEYGRRMAASVDGLERLYFPGPSGGTTACPAATGKRLFSRAELAVAVRDGKFADGVISNPDELERQALQLRAASERQARAYAAASALNADFRGF